MVKNRGITVIKKNFLQRDSLIPRKGKGKKVTLRVSGVISTSYPEPFLLESFKWMGKEWIMICLLCFMIQEFASGSVGE